VAAGTLSPYKARVLLILALAGNGGRPLAPTTLQAMFDTY